MASTRSSSETPPIPQFSGENFEIWSVKMRTFLQSQDLWEIVEIGYIGPLSPSKLTHAEEDELRENRTKDAKALCYLQQGISDDIFPRIMGATKAKQAWENLHEEFNHATLSSDEEDEPNEKAGGLMTKMGGDKVMQVFDPLETTPGSSKPQNIRDNLAMTSNMQIPNSGSIISPQFVPPYPLDLKVTRKITASEGKFSVTDMKGNTKFSVQGKFLTLHDRRTLLDACGSPLVSLRKKTISLHDRWVAYRDASTRSQDKLFTAKRSSLTQQKETLEVFLATSTKGDVCDFKIKGSWFDKSFIIYSGKTNIVVAEMHKKFSVQRLVLDKDTYILSLQANIDHAFVVSLLVIFDGIVQDDKDDERDKIF